MQQSLQSLLAQEQEDLEGPCQGPAGLMQLRQIIIRNVSPHRSCLSRSLLDIALELSAAESRTGADARRPPAASSHRREALLAAFLGLVRRATGELAASAMALGIEDDEELSQA